MDKEVEGVVKSWGGSLGVRISAKDARRIGLRPGMKVHCHVAGEGTIDLGEPPFFTDAPDVAQQHDRYLYGDR